MATTKQKAAPKRSRARTTSREGVARRLEDLVAKLNAQRKGLRQHDCTEKEADSDRVSEGQAGSTVIHLSRPDTLTFLAADLKAGLMRANGSALTMEQILFGGAADNGSGEYDTKDANDGIDEILRECGALLVTLNSRLCAMEGRL